MISDFQRKLWENHIFQRKWISRSNFPKTKRLYPSMLQKIHIFSSYRVLVMRWTNKSKTILELNIKQFAILFEVLSIDIISNLY